MQYKILMLNFDTPVPVGNVGFSTRVPWGNMAPSRSPGLYPPTNANREFDPAASFRLGSLQERYIILNDDDTVLHDGIGAPNETGQTLATTNATFGDGTPFPAGTRLAGYLGSRLIDEDGNIFRLQFPREFEQYDSGRFLGGMQSVLVFPEPRFDETGNSYLPEFNAGKSFSLLEIASQDRHADATLPQLTTKAPCFTQGTMILSTAGPRAIETLRPGDLIPTRDHGARHIRWIGGGYLDPRQLDLQPNLRPILIRAGALGPGTPQQDLIVSPQHRILITSKIARRMFDEDEILVAAKHLTTLPGIEAIHPENGVSYWHMLFDEHELVFSNGSWTESLFTGPQALKSITESARREIFALFPELARLDYRPCPVRRLLNGREGRKLAERHLKNGKPLADEI